MTSKISFSKLCRENLRHRTAFILITVFTCLMQLLGFVMRLQNLFYGNDNQPAYIRQAVEGFVQPDFTTFLIAMILGIGLAFDGLKALHFKQQMDLYGSLPVKRSQEYRMIFFNSFRILLIPAAFCTGAQIIILGVVGQLTGTVVGYVLLTFALSLLAFLAAWVMAALAIIMTGNIFVGLLGCGVFSCYMPLLIRFLIPSYEGIFFQTYISSEHFWGFLDYFSPFSLAYGMSDQYYGAWKLSEQGSYIIGTIIWILVIGCLGYYLYLRRPAEAAGRAMTFDKANPVIRFLIVIPMALYAGLFLQQMSLQSSIIWLFVGILLGVVLFHCIVECIYQFDVRGVFSHRKQLLATIVICLVYTGIFMADVFGYDRWMPERDQISSMELTLDDLNSRTDAFWGQKPDGITGERIDAALDLIREEARNTKKEGFGTSANESVQSTDAESCLQTITVTYHLKNGKEKKRSYEMDVNEAAEQIDRIYTTEDFKNDYYSLYTADRSKIIKMEWDNSFQYEMLNLTDEERDTFIDTYLEELTALSFTDLQKMEACSEFSVTIGKTFFPYRNGYSTDMTESYYIYPSFTKTIDFLKKHGIQANPLKEGEISKLSISVSDDEYEEQASYVITDPKVIEKYRKDLVMTAFDGYRVNFDDHIMITGTLITPSGKEVLDLRLPKEAGKKLLEDVKK